MPRMHLRQLARDERGFTLMELLVVMALFTTVVLIAADIFMLINRTQRKVFGYERTQADARYTMEAIAREVRTSQIDYAYYATRSPALALPDAELALIESDNTAIRFAVSTSATNSLCVDAASTPCLLVWVGSNSPQPVTPRNVAVRSAKFYVSPTTDPNVFNTATGTYNSDKQPSVTIALVLESKSNASAEQSLVYLQTTASNRSYKR